ncbi:hypothetical protein K491DRAFT_682314 [Lophiostoma macrostomum CBS 122681]|uniref:Rhodopsin domain-containing protein n=1 Tax=Lophiostoma macrostomum CBS 122681 TaxID=1314788 RepID=A0A6A6SUP5_9PLEO|nr:hypothetical protein K491DRAFT_682314 [Lophiostoma macrostomum CBS 122681]
MAASFATLTPAEQDAMLNGPALQPPPGVSPDFVNPPNQTTLAYGVLAVCASLATIVVAIRVYAKAFCNRKMHIEDYLAILALGLYATIWGLDGITLRKVGGYVHQWNVQLKDLSILLYDLNATAILYGDIIMLLKVGILLEWMRIFVPPGVRNPFFWICCVMICAHISFYVAIMIVEIFSCKPRERNWNRYLEGTCVDEYAVYISSNALNITSDVIILVLPHMVIWKLQIPMQRRIGISLVFAMGVVACICASMRLYYSIRFFRSEDKTYGACNMAVWAWGEMTAGFFVLCMPSVPKAIRNTPWMLRLGILVQRYMPGSGAAATGEKSPNSRRYHFSLRYHAKRRQNRQLETTTSDFSESALMRSDTSSTPGSQSIMEETPHVGQTSNI